MAEIVMPRLSDSMEEGTILTWLKAVGDEIAIGDEIVEIETDKANMAYEADVAGTLTAILAAEGDTLAVGSPIAVVGDPTAAGASPAPAQDAPPAGADAGTDDARPIAAESEAAESPVAAVPVGVRIKASPLAKRIARDRGLDLSGVAGSGPGGRIVKRDVEALAAAAAAVAPTPAPTERAEATETAKGTVTIEELSKLQQVVARRMAESKATAPHFYLEAEIDMSAAVEARTQLKAQAGEGDLVPSFNDMVVKACALALREFPRANGSYRDGRFELYSRVNVGVAVAARDALVVPTIFDADRKGLRQIAAETRQLAGRVRDGKITPPELSGGTFTVSNLGMYGVSNFSPVVNLPQAGILAVGAIGERPVVRDGEIAVAQMMDVTLACDHRILYGADGAQFLARIRALLEAPIGLAL